MRRHHTRNYRRYTGFNLNSRWEGETGMFLWKPHVALAGFEPGTHAWMARQSGALPMPHVPFSCDCIWLFSLVMRRTINICWWFPGFFQNINSFKKNVFLDSLWKKMIWHIINVSKYRQQDCITLLPPPNYVMFLVVLVCFFACPSLRPHNYLKVMSGLT